MFNQIQIISTHEELKACMDAIVNEAFRKLSTTKNGALSQTAEKPITGHELCRYLNISSPTLIRWRNKGRIPFIRIGGSIRYNRAAVIAALKSKHGGKAA